MERLDTIKDSIYVVKKLDAAKNDQSKHRQVDAIDTMAFDLRFPVVDNVKDMLSKE
jgi:hypothetical protein